MNVTGKTAAEIYSEARRQLAALALLPPYTPPSSPATAETSPAVTEFSTPFWFVTFKPVGQWHDGGPYRVVVARQARDERGTYWQVTTAWSTWQPYAMAERSGIRRGELVTGEPGGKVVWSPGSERIHWTDARRLRLRVEAEAMGVR